MPVGEKRVEFTRMPALLGAIRQPLRLLRYLSQRATRRYFEMRVFVIPNPPYPVNWLCSGLRVGAFSARVDMKPPRICCAASPTLRNLLLSMAVAICLRVLGVQVAPSRSLPDYLPSQSSGGFPG